jgi:ATP-dependent Clp protease ATP-binding subunit ClpA
MFERYTESARRALFFSRYEASELNRRSIETEHLLLGVLRAGKGVTSRLLTDAKISYEPVRATLQADAAEKIPTSVEIPFSEETKGASSSTPLKKPIGVDTAISGRSTCCSVCCTKSSRSRVGF